MKPARLDRIYEGSNMKRQLQGVLDLFADSPIYPRMADTGRLARTTDPHTSHEAAESVSSISAIVREQCLQLLHRFGPLTSHEIARTSLLDLDYEMVHKRMPELRKLGLVEWKQIGEKTDRKGVLRPIYETRPSPSGRQECVWHLTEKA